MQSNASDVYANRKLRFIGAATRLRQLGHLELSDAQDYLQSPLADVPTVVSQLLLSVLKRFPASAGSKYATAVHDTLSLLSVCKRSMTAGEIREGLIYDLHNSTWDNYLVNFQYEVWRLFPALLELGGQLGKNGSGRAADNLYLVHPSLKEMLQSDSMRKGPLGHLAVDTTKAQQDIAERCVSHLLRYSTSDSYRSKDGRTAYAGKYWHVHVKKSRLNGSEDLTTKSLSLLDPQTPSFAHWIYMTKRDDEISTNASEDFHVQEVSPAPLYYAALLGLYNCALKLIRNGADVNARGGQHGSPLLAAVIAGEGELVELLAASADTTEINRAVLKAVELGRPHILSKLLGYGADVSVRQKSDEIDGRTMAHVAAERDDVAVYVSSQHFQLILMLIVPLTALHYTWPALADAFPPWIFSSPKV